MVACRRVPAGRPKRGPQPPLLTTFLLEMFPVPLGRTSTSATCATTPWGDVVARYKRARGFNVLHPMGWDAFGMPAENAAMENKVHPKEWTYKNIATMRDQLKSMGPVARLARGEVATCDPSYYKHQQAMFLDFLEGGPRRPQDGQGELGPRSTRPCSPTSR